MQDKVNIIVNLIDKHLKGMLNPEEKKELEEWLEETEENRVLFSQLTDKKVLAEKLYTYDRIDSEAVWQQTLQKIDETKEKNATTGLVVDMPQKRTGRKKIWLAAAVLIGLTIAGTWMYVSLFTQKTDDSQVAVIEKNTDIVPGSDKATLELADGTKINLESENDGIISNQSGLEVSKKDGELIYKQNSATLSGIAGYNTITTPKGGQFRVTLPDGSKVWLNAASSLRFPIAFAGNERLVQLAGEAYFEVVTLAYGSEQVDNNSVNSKMPFIVKIPPVPNGGGQSEIQVLGTSFNVMAYTDEAAVKTTLVEGTVKITRGAETTQLTPNHQASIKDGKINIKEIDAEEITSWKNGYLPLEGFAAQEVLRQVSRWYDIEIVYKGKIPEIIFGGKLRRDATIEAVVDILNTNNVPVLLDRENRKLIVEA